MYFGRQLNLSGADLFEFEGRGVSPLRETAGEHTGVVQVRPEMSIPIDATRCS
jgi:hypothetical protein